jgi:hypothetical protein
VTNSSGFDLTLSSKKGLSVYLKGLKIIFMKKRQRDTEAERGRETQRDTERQRDRETERQRDRETERQRDREISKGTIL